MFQKCSMAFLAIYTAVLLSACGGEDIAPAVQQAAPVAAAAVQDPVFAAAVPATPQQPAIAAAVSAPAPGNLPAILHPVQRVSESERRAEELRLVDFEQSYSIEMNRRAQEQAEKERRSDIAASAGIVQAPGCEGVEGHAALECARSVI